MITKTDRETLKKIIGTVYTTDVLEILTAQGKLNIQGNEHNTEYISKVFSGSRENADVEAAILELAKRRQLNAKKAEQIKRKILNKNK